ncbi:DNA replication/repair protein RecF [Gehongia tenuis]|uniref:DNA replication and repair protein RecF n=1 Tax=Gehongia tenuis TaxID=2763655 RepID=A0A926D6B8_9FIRM|nr:DNA replication/repair protein RecF [Gehongia tenuis]MBC8532061.1 DNA replication/repair protein RecF [Gehongia tenuis]
MNIERLRLLDFRNYGQLDIHLHKGVNLLFGRNAQGKTNLLESLLLCCSGRSHRTRRDDELVRFGKDRAFIRVDVNRKDGPRSVEVVLSRKEKKRIRINGSPILRIRDLLGHVNAVMFSPEDLNLVKGGPAMRRRFMDMELCQIHPSYYDGLMRYHRAMDQRNMVLKRGQEELLEPFEMQMAQSAAVLTEQRARFLQRLQEQVNILHPSLTDGLESMEVCYRPGFHGDDFVNEFQQKLRENRSTDMLKGITSAGPHKDDFDLLLKEKSLRSFGSQGQQRTAALTLKLGELALMEEDIGEAPILLLDDVLSELDERRQRLLLLQVQSIQTLLTATHMEPLENLKSRVFYIQGGQAMEKKKV